jgi:hypothetical protein
LLGWGRKASKTQGGNWDFLSGVILRGTTGTPSLFRQLIKFGRDYRIFLIKLLREIFRGMVGVLSRKRPGLAEISSCYLTTIGI